MRLMGRSHRPVSTDAEPLHVRARLGKPPRGKEPFAPKAMPPGAPPAIKERPRRPLRPRAQSLGAAKSLPLCRPRPNTYTSGPSPCWPLTNRVGVFPIPLFRRREREERRRRRREKGGRRRRARRHRTTPRGPEAIGDRSRSCHAEGEEPSVFMKPEWMERRCREHLPRRLVRLHRTRCEHHRGRPSLSSPLVSYL
jgi:hypothetical protein